MYEGAFGGGFIWRAYQIVGEFTLHLAFLVSGCVEILRLGGGQLVFLFIEEVILEDDGAAADFPFRGNGLDFWGGVRLGGEGLGL